MAILEAFTKLIDHQHNASANGNCDMIHICQKSVNELRKKRKRLSNRVHEYNNIIS